MQMTTSAIYAFTPEVKEITYVEHGADNIIALVNEQYVFRFPRHEAAAKRLAYETALLQKIKGHISVVEIPELLQVHTRPLYVVAQYIPGEHMSGAQIQAFSEDEQAEIGRTIATFIMQLNQAISGLEVRNLRTQAVVDSLDEPWPQYFERIFVKTPLPNDKLEPIVRQYYDTWKSYVASEQNTYAIHDDLHPSNLLFSGSKLSGIVDFGDTNIGSIESELRWLYLMGDIVLRSAVDHYGQLTGAVLELDHVRVWAIMHELAAFTSRLSAQQTDSYPFKRAEANLRQWIPNFPF